MPHMKIPPPNLTGWRKLLFNITWPLIKRFAALMWADHSYAGGMAFDAQNKSVEKGCLHNAQIAHDVSPEELARIPAQGAVMVVSNHPYGMGEGLIQSELAQEVRADSKQIVNEMLLAFPLLARRYITVNVFETPEGIEANQASIRQAMQWLRDGHLIATFPAGAVSHSTWKNSAVLDPPWNPSILMLARRTKATIVPMYFDGHNGRLFQWAGLLSARLRSYMIPRAYKAMRGSTVRVRIGRPIPPETVSRFHSRETAIGYLRSRVYMMGAPATSPVTSPHTSTPTVTAPSSATDSNRFLKEVQALSEDTLLGGSGDLEIHIAKAQDIPGILEEIGRLREVTYRAVGEGSGNDLDLDEYDRHYRHLFIWNRKTHEVVGAYRIGLTDEILPACGLDGLYTRTLFDYDQELLDRLGPTLELGRSFIRLEYQRGFKPLMLLWRGISTFAARQRRYRHAFGGVSVSDEYAEQSKQLIAGFLARSTMQEEFASLVSPRTPYQPAGVAGVDIDALLTGCETIEDVDELVRDIEHDNRPVPVLVRQYLKLEARLLTPFNLDTTFSNVIDGLMLVDFMQVERRIAHFYLGKALAGAFREAHGFDPTFGVED